MAGRDQNVDPISLAQRIGDRGCHVARRTSGEVTGGGAAIFGVPPNAEHATGSPIVSCQILDPNMSNTRRRVTVALVEIASEDFEDLEPWGRCCPAQAMHDHR